MKLIHGLYNLPAHLNGSVVTIGNFDGVHSGHQSLISACMALAKKRQVPSVLMTFEPYPQAYFSGDKRFPRLMTLRDKFFALQTLGIDYLCVLPFNAAMADLSPEDFIQTVLVKHLKVEGVVVGDDFRFGAKRAGEFSLLRTFSQKYGFELQQIPTCVYKGERVSSSRLRAALEQGRLDLAKALLGYSYRLSGKVVAGDKRGKQFGFPTANIYTGQKKLPLAGIFVVEVEGLGEQPVLGVASVGYRPMYPTEKDMLEVFLLDFNRDIYQQHCTVLFLKKLRDEIKFSSEAALIAQIEIDVRETRQFFEVESS